MEIATPEGPQSGLNVLLRAWTELFEVIQGYKEIRLSVVALARVFEFGGDVEGIIVKGEIITEPGRIVTRSQRRKSICLVLPPPLSQRFPSLQGLRGLRLINS